MSAKSIVRVKLCEICSELNIGKEVIPLTIVLKKFLVPQCPFYTPPQ